MYRISLIVVLTLMLAACKPAAPPTPTVPPIVGDVQITTPVTGSIIYAPTIYLSGTASGIPAGGFRLLITSAEDETIADTTVTTSGDTWAVEFPNPVTDTPVEITILALPTDATVPGDYDVVSVMLAAESLRPEGVFGTINAPFDGDSPGGDIIPVFGTASGLFEGTMNLALEQPDGTVISELVLTVPNPGMMDEVPWAAEVTTNGYRGEAVIRAYYHSARDGEKITLDTVTVTVQDAAG
jgi:hypothetical protein